MTTEARTRTGTRPRLRWPLLAALAAAVALAAPTGWAKGGKDALAHYDRYQKIDDLFDASGAVQLPDGRIMLVTDSRTAPVSFLRLEGDRFVMDIWTGESLPGRSDGKVSLLADLEEAAVGPDGFVYGLSSHAKEGADSFARFRLDGERMQGAGVFTALKGVLASVHPALAAATKIEDSDTGFNLEGFAFAPDGKRALVGFRSPLIDNKAVVVAVDDPATVFKDNAVPRLGAVTLLDLGGDGIRGMAWLPKINGYLIAGRMDSSVGKGPFRLWFWSGDPKAKPRAVFIDSLKSLRRPEGIAPVVVNGEERILLVSDEGNRREGKPSQIALIAYDRLRILP
jgi:uncharacterized protein DUF3616